MPSPRKTPSVSRSSEAHEKALVSLVDAALAGMQASVVAMKDGIEALKETVEILKGAVFGHWDKDQNRQVPGLMSRFEALEMRIRILTWAGGAVSAVLLARALGVPTEIVGRLILGVPH